MGVPFRRAGDRGQEIILLGLEDAQVGGRPGRDDAHDFAPDQPFAGAGLFHLVADGDFEAGAEQAREVGLGGVVGHAAHGDGLAALAIAGGQGDLQFARRRRWRLRRTVRRSRPGETAAGRAGSCRLIVWYCRISGVEASLMRVREGALY